MMDPARVALFIPPGLRKFKLRLFERIGQRIVNAGGQIVRHEFSRLARLPAEIVPIVGCTGELKPLVQDWIARRRPFIYWDRGYARRVFATCLPKGENGGYYRWHLNAFQQQTIGDFPDDRWASLDVPLAPWRESGRHIVVAAPTPTYERYHGIEGWTERTLCALARVTDRELVVRHKESPLPLQADVDGAHCLVAHGSIAAVEAVILGCPVVVDPSSAAALVGLTDIALIENPICPDRQPWVNALAYSQFNEHELIDGTLWRLIT